ncbi:MAG: PilZ domain-containing protein [Armatimonadetes bacterium]|nr:PilZ domain-containing protein [Armatimonadota bacterium]
MFDYLKKMAGKTPEVEVLDYQKGKAYFRCPSAQLDMGPTEVVARLPDQQAIEAKLDIQGYSTEDYIYEGRVLEPLNLGIILARLFPAAIADASSLPWYEKREVPRVSKVLMVMSPQVPGFKTVTFDLSPVGVRLDCDEKMEPGTAIRVRLEFDDHRWQPLEFTGTTKWSKRKLDSTKYWVGVSFSPDNDPESVRMLEEYYQKVKTMDRGVFTREYEIG